MHRAPARQHQRVRRSASTHFLHTLIDNSAAGGLIRCRLSGEPGAGRSTLLRQFRQQKVPVVLVAGSRHGTRIVEALGDALVQAASARKSAEAVRAADRLGRVLRSVPSSRHRAARAVRGCAELVEILADERPLVIALDDADQAHPQALGDIGDLLGRSAHLPVTVLLSTRHGRSSDASPELAGLLADARHLPLDGFTVSETALLLRIVTGASYGSATVAMCHRLTAGNPFLISEVGRWMRSNGFRDADTGDLGGIALPSVVDRMLGRVQQDDPQARSVAEAIAVATGSEPADPLWISQIADLPVRNALVTLDRLASTRIVHDRDAVTLRHPLLRSSLLDGMTTMGRNAAHLSAAVHLHASHGPPQRIAEHLLASSVPAEVSWSARLLMEAARSAGGATPRGARFLDLATRTAVGDEYALVAPELAAARIAMDSGSGLTAAADLLGHSTDTVVHRRLLTVIGAALCEDVAEPDQRRVFDRIKAHGVSTNVREWERGYRVLGRMAGARPSVCARLCAEYLRSADTTATLRPAVQAIGAWNTYLIASDPRPALQQARQALDAGSEDLLAHPMALPAALLVLLHCGHGDEATDRQQHVLTSPCPPSPWTRDGLALVAAMASYDAGQIDEGRRLLDDRLVHITVEGRRTHRAVLAGMVGLLANILLDLDDQAAAKNVMRRYHFGGELPPDWFYSDVLLAQARLRILAGDLASAGACLQEASRRRHVAGLRGPGSVCWRIDGARLLLRCGHVAEAIRQAQRQMQFAGLTGSPLDQARAQRVAGLVGKGAEAVRLHSSSLAMLEGLGSDAEVARSEAELGSALAREGRREEALDALTRAARLAADAHTDELHRRVTLELAAIERHAPHDSLARGMLELTPRERQILTDAVYGLGNGAIARQRHITRRTVELHLSSAYRKLGISGRDDFGRVSGQPALSFLLSGKASSAAVTGPTPIRDRPIVGGGPHE